MLKKTSFLSFLIALLVQVQAQDVNFTQFYADKIYLNPSLAGSSPCKRLYTSYRNQWPNIQNAYTTGTISYDQKVSLMHGGIGFRMMYDRQGDGNFNNVSFDAVYSYHLKINDNYAALFGLQTSVFSYFQQTNGLIFPDQISNSGIQPNVSEVHAQNFAFIDFSTGASFYGRNFYIGAAVNHLAEPALMTDENREARLRRKITIHGGIKFVLLRNKRFHYDEFSISPNIVFQQQGPKDKKMNYGLYFQYRNLVVGTWARHVHWTKLSAVSVLFGLDMQTWRFGYSYDYSVSQLSVASGGAHELTLNYFFDCASRQKYRGKGTINCPSF